MKNKLVRLLIPTAILSMSVLLTGYANNLNSLAENSTSEVTADTSETESTEDTASSTDEEEWYSDRDLEQTPDTTDAETIQVIDGETISITEEGTYILTGTASECTVLVNAPDAKVQFILDGVSVTNTSAPVIYVLDADKCFVTTAEGSDNSLTVTGTFEADTENDVKTDAVIFTKSDLTLNGTGTLTINSSDNGITSKDDITVTGGTYSITAAGKGLESNDSTAISDGIFSISAEEGMESTYIRIDGGTIDIDASDDGLNATNNSDKYSVLIEINGGELSIDMGSGDTDGIDSNGDLTINGGTIDINCNSPFDYDGTGTLNGGTVTANGEEVTELTNQMMGGHGGMGQGGMDQGNMGQGGFGHGGRDQGNMGTPDGVSGATEQEDTPSA